MSEHLPSNDEKALELHRLQGKGVELLVAGQRGAVTGWDHQSLLDDHGVMDAI